MPEYPDIEVYIAAIRSRIMGRPLLQAKLNNPFLLRTVEPPLEACIGARASVISRVGKRIALAFDDGSDEPIWMVFHLMIAGRLHWKAQDQKAPGKQALAVLSFDNGHLYLTEAGSKRRASLHLFAGDDALQAVNPGGLEVLEADVAEFTRVFTASNHTLKRALTDPRILSGIGNAYSDEILHRACLSPVKLTQSLNSDELKRLYEAIHHCLQQWREHLARFYGEQFPEKVTAFRPEMAAHGRFGKPCPVCSTPIQRIRYASNETNYCPSCQTGGKLLADRSLSRLLKKDWPRTVDELEKLKGN